MTSLTSCGTCKRSSRFTFLKIRISLGTCCVSAQWTVWLSNAYLLALGIERKPCRRRAGFSGARSADTTTLNSQRPEKVSSRKAKLERPRIPYGCMIKPTSHLERATLPDNFISYRQLSEASSIRSWLDRTAKNVFSRLLMRDFTKRNVGIEDVIHYMTPFREEVERIVQEKHQSNRQSRKTVIKKRKSPAL